MGVVLKESSKNTVTLIASILIGGVNTLFLYSYFLDSVYYGLVSFVLSSALILKPLISFGINFSVIKFFSFYTDTKEKDKFLSFVLWVPLFVIVPIGVLVVAFYDRIASFLADENTLIEDYTYFIWIASIAIAYFEIFYAWSKVHLKSVYGNFLKEFFVRFIITFLLIAVGFKWINSHQFVVAVVLAYIVQTLLMMLFAFKMYIPKFTFAMPKNYKEILKYCFYVILSGSAASILLDIDKVMIPQTGAIEQVAFYAVAVYIGTVIEIPGRAMGHIIQPLTAKALNENNKETIQFLYQKSSINLLIVSGLLFVLVNANLDALYSLLPIEYRGGAWVVLMISTAKLYLMLLGNNGAIISNSKFYKILLPYGIATAVSVIALNHWLIGLFGINGAALATLIVVLVFNTLKLIYVKKKFHIYPTSINTWKTLLLILILAAVGKYVNFKLHPILTILAETIFFTIIYSYLVLKFNLSTEITDLYHKRLRRKTT